jgi:hypothetical protein
MAKEDTSEKKWTFMVYLAGDNNLDQNGVTDLKEMKKVGSTDDLNIIAQFDRAGPRQQTKRYFLRKGTSLTKDTVAKLEETNSGSPEALYDFIDWGITQYPAERYAVVLWNHGGGWDDEDVYASERYRPIHRLARGRIRHAFFSTTVQQALEKARTAGTDRAILYDDDAKDFLDNMELKKVFSQVMTRIGKKVDLLGMDACLMNMAEVCYQLRDSVQISVGSEETEPLNGWPYHTILKELAKDPGMETQGFGGLIVDNYLDSYRASAEEVTQSVCILENLGALKTAVATLAEELNRSLERWEVRNGIYRARLQTQSYYIQDNIDLVDLCSMLEESCAGEESLCAAAQGVIEATAGTQGLISRTGYQGEGMQNSHGLAIYFPLQFVSPLYQNLDFAQDTGWGEFLNRYIEASHRRPRVRE